MRENAKKIPGNDLSLTIGWRFMVLLYIGSKTLFIGLMSCPNGNAYEGVWVFVILKKRIV